MNRIMDLDYSTLTSEELSNLDTLIIQIYRQMTTSNYIKDIKYSEFVNYTKHHINKSLYHTDPIKKLKGLTYFTNGLLSIAKRFDTYRNFENRFNRYFTILFKQHLPLMENVIISFLNDKRELSEEAKFQFFLDSMKPIISQFSFKIISDLLLKIKFSIWQNWLQNPTLEGYKKIQISFSKREKENNLQYILPLLEEHLYSPPIQRTYLKILSYEGLHKGIQDYMLRYEHQPLLLNDEKKGILKQLEKHNIKLLLPVYHQFIVRLIEKRTRAHYVEAVNYMKKLQKIYISLNDRDSFHQFILLMKKNYKSYRALIQEMKKLDHFVQSK